MEQPKIDSVWAFVQKYFPGYTSSDLIAWEGDLDRILEEEGGFAEDDDSCAAITWRTYLKGCPDLSTQGILKRIKEDQKTMLFRIYEKAIENFINNGPTYT
jgi:hypothetical protein